MKSPIKLDENEQAIVDQLESLHHERFMAVMSHIEWLKEIREIESEAAEQLVAVKVNHDDEWMSTGRHKALHYARMQLSTAEIAKDLAMKRLRFVLENWEKLPKDTPIYWARHELAGDFLHVEQSSQEIIKMKSPKVVECAKAVLEWYDRDGSVGGAVNPMENLRKCL